MTSSLLDIVQSFDDALGLNDVDLTTHIFKQLLYKSRDIPQPGSITTFKPEKQKLLPRTPKKQKQLEQSSAQKVQQIASIVQNWQKASESPPQYSLLNK